MFHVKHAWPALGASIGLTLSTEQVARLERYEGLLAERAVPLGMIAEGDRERLRERHVFDALRGAPGIPEGSQVVDLGSGAGLPGIPLAIGCPTSSFLLVEPRRNRAAFLELVVDTLGLANAAVAPGRIEAVPGGSCDVVVARAFSDAAGSWDAARRLLRPRGRLLYWAGRSGAAPPRMPGVVTELVPPPSELADAGPVVIMSPQ